jgi:Ni/Co efflux regulator RcnB
MKIARIVSAVLALSLSASGLSFAQGDKPAPTNEDVAAQLRAAQQGQRGNPGNNRRNNPGNNAGHQPDQRQPQARGYNNAQRDQRGYDNSRRDERGAGPDHSFHRGERLPPQYRTNRYVVDDWRGHNLSAPPRGYHWVQTGGDYVLAAIATGLILQLLLNN